MRFDTHAVPHVYAGSDLDAWRAVGYLQARDRLWQMELYRRAASGRLSELLGTATIEIDRRFITLGLRPAAEREWQTTAPPVRAALERYSAGVNAVIAAETTALPLEHQLLRIEPEPWTPIDTLAIGKLFAWRLGENHTAELLRHDLVNAIGERALDLFPSPPDWAPTILQTTGERTSVSALAPHSRRVSAPAAALPAAGSRSPQKGMYPPGLEWLSSDSRAFSNSWVVHGSRTASGRPLLANDPHLVIEMPSVWWEVHVVSDTFNVAGVTIPGIPFVIIGHNERLAWGLTNVGADVQDFFVERLNPARDQYREGTAWRPLDVARHQLRVRGEEQPREIVVRSTPRGPVLPAEEWRDPEPGAVHEPAELGDTVLSLKWDVAAGTSAMAFEALGRARNWMEFVGAVRQFSAPAQNFVYADVDGNIGYAMSGHLPIREKDAVLPQDAAGARWIGTHDPDELPAVLNPPSGQIVTANNEVDPNLPFVVTHDWVAPFRARRIIELLGDRRGLDMPAMRAIQADIVSGSAAHILNAIELPESVKELRAWNRRVDARAESLLYEAFEEALWRRTFADEMPAPLFDRFYRYAGNERFAGLHAVIDDANSPWFDDRSTGVRETRETVVNLAAADAVAALESRLGDRSRWRWDRAHAVTFSHALAGGGWLLDWFFSRGPVPVAGDSMTVNKTTTNLRRPYTTSEAASYRQILDVGAWDGSLAVNTTGQSGHPRSPHYFDQNRLWRQGDYRRLPFTRRSVEAATVSILELTP